MAGCSSIGSTEEDFRLWQALHLSQLEAEATAEAEAPVPAAAAHRQQASLPEGSRSALPGPPPAPPRPPERSLFEPPSRGPLPAVAQEAEGGEDAGEAERPGLRAVRCKLDSGGELATVDALEGGPSAGARTEDAAALEVYDPSSLLGAEPELFPDTCKFLDPYGLDRAACACRALCRMSRGSLTWRTLARRCLPEDDCASVLAAGPGSADGTGVWRHLLLAAPRLRMDGVYAAHCGYRRRVPQGSSLTDQRESMYIRYFRLLRFLPAPTETEGQQEGGGPALPPMLPRRALVLTFEGDLGTAVEALKTHPAGHAATFGTGHRVAAEAPGHVRKLHDRTLAGTCAFDPEQMVVTVKYKDNSHQYVMALRLNGAAKGPRQNTRLAWIHYESSSLKLRDDVDRFNLQREQHYRPYSLARVPALEHLA